VALETLASAILRFGTFEVDLRTGELRKQRKRIKLQDQPFQVLAVLLQHPGHIVSRDELRKHIWPQDTFVDFDSSLNTAVNKLREAIGDSADNPRFIETLPRRGYRFVAPISGNQQKKSSWVVENWKATTSVAMAVFLLGTVGGVFFSRSRRARLLTDKDTIVLADFTNTTGDPVFDDTLKEGLRVQLEQSPYLNILSDQRVGKELQLMGRAKDERLTKEVAREVCERAGGKVFLAGSISIRGTHYAVGLNALNCHTGDTLYSTQMEQTTRSMCSRR
jgi:DNA-binding winged helix-turn-helix (wHTH) protein